MKGSIAHDAAHLAAYVFKRLDFDSFQAKDVHPARKCDGGGYFSLFQREERRTDSFRRILVILLDGGLEALWHGILRRQRGQVDSLGELGRQLVGLSLRSAAFFLSADRDAERLDVRYGVILQVSSVVFLFILARDRMLVEIA